MLFRSIAIAVVVVFVWPDFAFNYLMSIATIAAAINWIMIMLTEIKFRRVVAAGDGPNDLKGLKGQEALDKLAFKLPFAKVTPYAVIAFMLLVVVLMCFSASYRISTHGWPRANALTRPDTGNGEYRKNEIPEPIHYSTAAMI